MSGDKGQMISDKLASKNNLSIGSNVSIQYENNTLSIKVIGIYTVNKYAKDTGKRWLL